MTVTKIGRKTWRRLVVLAGLASVLFLFHGTAKAASFDSSNLISDGTYMNVDAMSAGDVQTFLNQYGGFLKSYSENGRSAAQIIYDAAHGYGDASGSINGITINTSTGTVNPQVLLVTLQKEQSLVTMANQNDSSLRTAMGYGCPDSGGCNSAYAGFTKQVENAAWQLRYNYERAQGHGFGDYQVGQSFCFSDANGTNCGTYGNRATASLYRYTPHVYNGNYNFYTFFTNWFVTLPYSASWVSQSRSVTITPAQPEVMTISYRNTGSYTWQKGTVRLGLVNQDYSWKLTPYALASSWPYDTRPANLNEASVAPGNVGTFTFMITDPNLNAGNYRLDVGLVAEGITWFPATTHAYWDVTVPPSYSAAWVSQSRNVTITQAQPEILTVAYRNTGNSTWQKGTIRLGLLNPDGSWKFNAYPLEGSWLYTTRPATMNEDSVAPGDVGTFSFPITDPGVDAGSYRLDVGLLAEGITWFSNTHAYWDVSVPATYTATWTGQSNFPTLSNGQTQSLTVSYVNTGSLTWKKGVVRLGLLNKDGSWKLDSYALAGGWPYSSRPANLNEDLVAPGQTGTFTFNVSDPALSAGNYRLDVGLVAEGITWLPANTHAYWDVFVQ